MQQNRFLGFLLLTFATAFTSTAGVLLRWLDEPAEWRTIFYRALFFAATLIVWVGVTRRGRYVQALRSVGATGLLCALFYTISTTTFVFALFHTTVARTVFINGLTPLLTGIIAWILLRERVAAATWAGIALAMAGIVIMTREDLSEGSVTGDTLALVCSLSAATMYTMIRRGRAVDMLPAFIVAAFMTAAVAAPWIDDFAASWHDIGIYALLGCVQLGVQYVLLTMGARHLPAAEAALTTRMTLVLAPLFAWLGAGEVPGEMTLIGGAVIVAAILLHGAWTLHGERRRAKVPAEAMGE
ncbi:MAG: membrane protein [Alphaproteobacteria bacterium]|nr:MAG: membrane protein [Alphaproteobacteria bacterium]